MTADNKPEQQQIEHWLKNSQERIDGTWEDYHSGFYEKEDLPMQTTPSNLAGAHASFARAQFLNGEPRKVFRESFSKAAGYTLKSFTMAYDETDPDYVGDRKSTDISGFGYGCVSWFQVSEREFVEGINYALMGADFDSARELAKWFRDPPNGKMEKEINRYAHALKFALLGEKDRAKALVKQTLDEWKGRKTKDPFKMNYRTLSMALYGTADNDETVFNQGLTLQLSLYQSYAQGEGKDTDYEFICDDAVALANLGREYGLKVTAEHYTLPNGLLIRHSCG